MFKHKAAPACSTQLSPPGSPGRATWAQLPGWWAEQAVMGTCPCRPPLGPESSSADGDTTERSRQELVGGWDA